VQSAEGPIDPAFSRHPKPPALAGGVFTFHVVRWLQPQWARLSGKEKKRK
jgi:hypothetical protein